MSDARRRRSGRASSCPIACKAGVCSTCRAMLTEGEVDMDANYALEDYEIARGYILTCQSYPDHRQGRGRLRQVTGDRPMSTKTAFSSYLAGGGKLSAPDNAPPATAAS